MKNRGGISFNFYPSEEVVLSLLSLVRKGQIFLGCFCIFNAEKSNLPNYKFGNNRKQKSGNNKKAATTGFIKGANVNQKFFNPSEKKGAKR